MTHNSRFNAAEARRRRDAGIASVLEHGGPWVDTATLAALYYIETTNLSFTGEDIRRNIVNVDGVGSPHSPNAWGGLIMRLIKNGEIEPTGHRSHMESVKSHGRSTGRYIRKRY